MFTRKPKSQYHLDIKTYSIDAPKIVKTKKTPLRKALASILAVLFLGTTLVAGATIPAQATNYHHTCFLDASDDNWFMSHMGGMMTSMINPSKADQSKFFGQASVNSLTTAEKEAQPTMRDKYGEQIRFVSWVPALRDSGDDVTTDTTKISVWNGIKNDSSWSETTDRNKFDLGTGTWVATKDSPIRAGEETDRGFADFKCISTQAGKEWVDVAPNFFFQIAKGVSNITTFLYVNASTGSNISDVVGLNTASIASSPDQVLEHDATQNQSWAYNFGSAIQGVLTGTNRDGTPTGQNGLYSDLYLNFLLPIVLIGTIVILLNAIRARAIKAFSGIVWMIVAIISGMLLLQRPMMIPEIVDGLVGTISSEVNRAIIGKTDLKACDIPDGSATGDYTSKTKREAKEMECYIWYYTIYIPWAEGQFGVQSYDKAISHTDSVFYYQKNADVLDVAIPIGYQTVNPLNDKMGWPLYQLEYMERPAGANVAIAQSQAIVNGVGNATNGGKSQWFSGGDRIGASLLALAVSLSAGIFISVNSALIIGYQIAMLLLLMVAPVFLLIGAIPSQMGKGIGLRWAELIVGLTVKRMVIVLLMAVFIKMFIIVASIENIGVGFQIIIFTVLSVLGITKRNEIMDLFTGNINFGGNKSISTSGVENLGTNAGKIAVGGMIAGAAIGGKLARKGAVSTVKNTAGAAGRGVRNARYESAVKKEQRKMFDAGSDEKRAELLEKRNRRRVAREERDEALGRRATGGTGGGHATINEQGQRKLRGVRAAAKATVAQQIQNGDINFNDKSLRPDSMREATWKGIKNAPAKTVDTARRTIDAAKEIPESVRQNVFETKEDIKDVMHKAGNIGIKNATPRAREVYIPKEKKTKEPKEPKIPKRPELGNK